MAQGSDAPLATPVRGLRTHPATPLVRVWLWLLAAVVGSLQWLAHERPTWRIGGIVLGAILVALALGFLLWWFTRYVIDGQELRIESGVITKRSRRIPYERIQSVDIAQPLGARIFGLAELRIEMAGGENARTQLQFLGYPDAQALRVLLLDRAHARTGSTRTDDGPVASDSLIAAVSPYMLLLGLLVSIDFLAGVVVFLGLVVGSIVLGLFLPMLAAIVPFASGVAQTIGKRVIAQWGFRLTRTNRGLRIERGLLSRVSQTVPFDRVQGVSVRQPIVWRKLRWKHLEVDVAGYAGSDGDHEDASSTLLPVGTYDQARTVVAQLVDGVDPDRVPLTSAPRRSAWFAPVGWRFRGAGADDRAFVSRSGWIEQRHEVVPHRKTQSVTLRQGPLQRRLSVATVSVQTPNGPVNARGRHLDAPTARDIAMAQVERARLARSQH